MRSEEITKFLESNIPEAKKIREEYYPEYWQQKTKDLFRWGKKRIRELSYVPDSMSVELAKFLFAFEKEQKR